MIQRFRNRMNIQRKLLLLSATLLFALQTAAQNGNGIDVYVQNGQWSTVYINPGVTQVDVWSLPDDNEYFSGNVTLVAPPGYLLKAFCRSSNEGTNVQVINHPSGNVVSCSGSGVSGFIWSENSSLTVSIGGGSQVSGSATVYVYDPTNICSEDDLKLFTSHKYIDNSYNTLTQHLKLQKNINLTNVCEIPCETPDSISIDLDLNGYELSRNLNNATANGSVLRVKKVGTLTITDSSYGGTITGGNTTGNGGAIEVLAGGTLYVNGGAISGCKASDKGGAIYNAGTTIVNGGSIRQNEGKYGGGIWNGGTMTINGGTIQSNTANSSGGGIYNKGQLTITGISTDGLSITDNKAPDGGGIFNDAGSGSTPSVLSISGGSITKNEATTYGGGGITNYGTIVMSNGTIEYNSSKGRGSGIWVGGDAGTITMFGTPVIKNNNSQYTEDDANDLFLCNGKKIKLSSPFLDGACVCVTTEYGCSVPITDGGDKSYVELHPTAHLDAYIHYNGPLYGLIIYNNELARLPYVIAAQYAKDDGTIVTPEKCMDISKLVAADGMSFGLGNNDGEGWFILDDDKKLDKRLYVKGKTNLILKDEKTLTLMTGGLAVNEEDGSSLDIWTWSRYYEEVDDDSSKGSIYAEGQGGAGIGGDTGKHSGPITIHGGNITAKGGSGAAIGGGLGACNGPIHIVRGHIETFSGTELSAAIGCGGSNGDDNSLLVFDPINDWQVIDVDPHVYNASITIDNGYIEANGPWGGAGIGGGSGGYFLGTITINGGEVHATGGQGAAGIGAGREGSCYLFRYPQAEPRERQATIIINGGQVYATAGQYAAAIGGGVQTKENPDLSDTEVTSMPTYQGGGANVYINGGYVSALPCDFVFIIALGAEAIGHGGATQTFTNKPVSGEVTLFDKARVAMPTIAYPPFALASERLKAVRKAAAVIETCDHMYNKVGTHEIVDGDNHSNCRYCLAQSEMEEHQFGEYGQCSGCGLIALKDQPVEKANEEAINHWAEEGEPHDVVLLGRNLYGNGLWNTLCLPFDLSETETTAMLAPSAVMTIKGEGGSAFADGTLTLNFTATEETEDAPYIKAGTPYIVKWEKEEEEGTEVKWASPIFRGVTFKYERNNYEDANLIFRGTFNLSIYNTENTSILFLKSQKREENEVEIVESTLFYPDGIAPTTIGPFRAYFELKEPLHAGELENPELPFVRSFNLNFGDGEQTAIDSAPSTANGTERTVSTIAGAEAKPLKKGIYISGGRKVMVK